MKGKLYGIGTGPGDPELLTLKAIKTIEKCDVIAIPSVKDNEKTAFSIIEQYVTDKPLIECSFSMEKSEEKRKIKRVQAANKIINLLEQEKNVGFITLGDPTIYSTYMYVHNIVKAQGYQTEIISGIPSFVAAAAALDMSLCEGNELLHIIPAANDENIELIADIKGNKVIMKTGKSSAKVLDMLKQTGANAKVVERCTMADEKIFGSIEDYEKEENRSYFSIIIVKE